jgi:hypothetical protein
LSEVNWNVGAITAQRLTPLMLAEGSATGLQRAGD